MNDERNMYKLATYILNLRDANIELLKQKNEALVAKDTYRAAEIDRVLKVNHVRQAIYGEALAEQMLGES